MADGTAIEWTDATWTPIRARSDNIGWHCEHVSEGCRNCYAEGINRRVGTGLSFKPGLLGPGGATVFLDEKMLLAPLKWKKPRRIFVCSMTDLFADFVRDEWIDRVFAVMALCQQHRFQVLTKRAKRMREYISHTTTDQGRRRLCLAFIELFGRDDFTGDHWAGCNGDKPLPNVWLGVSAEDQKCADERIPDLLATPAAMRFVSLEPLLGPIDLKRIPMPQDDGRECSAIDGHEIAGMVGNCVGWIPPLDWVIAGGESGPHARPMHPDWARSIRDQCAVAGVPFFFKQWGAWQNGSDFADDAMAVLSDGRVVPPTQNAMLAADREATVRNAVMMRRVGKKRAGRLLDGREWNEMPA